MSAASSESCGRYELVRYLTAGGMADLWLARSPELDVDVVVKKIQPRYVEFTRVVKMFIDEGRIAQALDHPNIVKILDVGQEGGTYYIAMEYIPGRDLLAVCRRGVEVKNFLPRPLAVAILVQALRGLQHAHEKIGSDGRPLKVVHCDLSPGNIVVSWGGTAKVVDFGISRATIQLRVEEHAVAGKWNYMAPEQIRGERVDARADIFSMGILLYELTCGRRLFRGRPEQVMRLVIEEPITPPSQLVAGYPLALERVVMRALERDPRRRYQTARELRDELMIWLAEQGEPHGKHQLAVYLRDIFGAEKVTESEEFGAEAEEELELDRGLPRGLVGPQSLPLKVDPEEPEDSTGSHVLPEVRRPAEPAALAAGADALPADAEPTVADATSAVADATAGVAAGQPTEEEAEPAAAEPSLEGDTVRQPRVEPSSWGPEGTPITSPAPLSAESKSTAPRRPPTAPADVRLLVLAAALFAASVLYYLLTR